ADRRPHPRQPALRCASPLDRPGGEAPSRGIAPPAVPLRAPPSTARSSLRAASAPRTLFCPALRASRLGQLVAPAASCRSSSSAIPTRPHVVKQLRDVWS